MGAAPIPAGFLAGTAAGWSAVRCSLDHSIHRHDSCARLAHHVVTSFKGIRPTTPLSQPPRASLKPQSLHTSCCRGTPVCPPRVDVTTF